MSLTPNIPWTRSAPQMRFARLAGSILPLLLATIAKADTTACYTGVRRCGSPSPGPAAYRVTRATFSKLYVRFSLPAAPGDERAGDSCAAAPRTPAVR